MKLLFLIDGYRFTEEDLGISYKNEEILKSDSKLLEESREFKVPRYRFKGREVIFYEKDDGISIKYKKFQKKKEILSKINFLPRLNYFDNNKLRIAFVDKNKDEIQVFYYTINKRNIKLGVLILDKKDPEKLNFRSQEEIVNYKIKDGLKLINLIYFKNKIIFYWNSKSGILFTSIPFYNSYKEEEELLERIESNPILTPTDKDWENQFTFNPACFKNGKDIHLLYRAMGYNWRSVIGHCVLKNGVKPVYRSNEPIYKHETSEIQNLNLITAFKSANINLESKENIYGLSCCEDPRITKIGDELIKTYTAFVGYPRVAFTKIKLKNFLEGKFNWDKPKIISEDGKIQKNWVFFPEKINGKYAILHSITPDIQIEFRDDLEFKEPIISNHIKVGNNNGWDFLIRGVGAPPIKTNEGWLVIYHAQTRNEPWKYKLGAMLLDLNDPFKIIAKSPHPILVPKEDYEMDSGFKSGVVYCCGAEIIDGQLLVYYGAADNYTCVAKANLNEFLEKIKNNKIIKLKKIGVNKNGKKR